MIRLALRNVPRLFGDRGGAIIAESAIMLSLLTTLALSGAEIGRYTLLHQKLERVSAEVGDLVAQAETLSEADIANIFAAVPSVAEPFDIADNGVVIVSSVSASDGGPPTVNWQRSGGGSYAATSRIGTPGGIATLPAGFTLASGETVIVAEAIYRYTPWLLTGLTPAGDIYHSAFYRPRLGSLTAIQ